MDWQDESMQRAGIAWLLGLPLTLLGWLSAHTVAYKLVLPDEHERAHVLAASGHGYLEHVPLLTAACVVAAGSGFFLRASRRPGRPIPASALGVLPLFGFAVQEYLERALHTDAIPWATALDPVFLVGLALQLPFALLALAVARALTGLADTVGARARPRPCFPRGTVLLRPHTVGSSPTSVLASGHAGRAPPVPA